MASNVNLNVARIVFAAIQMTLGNGKRFSNNGFIQALRSPQNAGLIREMSPLNAKNDNRLSIDQTAATPIATVQLNYRPQINATIKSSRTVATGDNPTGASAITIAFNTHRELDLTYRVVDLMRLEKEAEDYLKASNNGLLSVNTQNFALLSDMGDQIMRRMDAVLQNVNSSVGTAVVAAAGGNLMIGQASPANLAVPNVKAYNSADGSISLDAYDWINNLKVVHAIPGRPIIIGGLKALNWVNRKNIASAANLGYNYETALNALDFEFYYDPMVDTLSGADHIIVLEPGAACMETIMEHESVITMPRVANTTYGSASVTVAQTGAPTFTMDMDFRVREEDLAYPQWTITPSMHYGVFTKPAGLIKNYGGWETQNGIYRAKLVSA